MALWPAYLLGKFQARESLYLKKKRKVTAPSCPHERKRKIEWIRINNKGMYRNISNSAFSSVALKLELFFLSLDS